MTTRQPQAYTFYDRKGKDYHFYARSEQEAINMAVAWARRRRIKLFRRNA